MVAPSDGRTSKGTTADSLGGQTAGKIQPMVKSEDPGQTLIAGDPTFAGKLVPASGVGETAEDSVSTSSVLTPAGHVADKKAKPASSSADGNTEPAPVSTIAQPGLDTSVLPVAVIDPLPPAPANQQAAGGDAAAAAPVEGQAQAIANPEVAGDSPLTGDPALPGGDPSAATAEGQATVSRFVAGALRDAPDARGASTPTDEPRSASDAKPAAGSIRPASTASVPSATDGTQGIPASLAALGSAQTGTPQKDVPALAPALAAGKDRSSAGEVRGKRKDTAVDGSAPERGGSTPASPAPFAAKLAEAQAPAQAGANDSSNADPAALQKALDGSQTPIPASTPASTQTNAPSTAATPAPVATPSVPGASADGSAEASATSGASSAQLIQSAGQTEMRLGMRSAEFGNISISTSVSHQAISAQISLDHSELGRALAVHLPAIEAKLGSAYGLEARVEVRDESAASRSATDAGQQGGASQEQAGGARDGQGRSQSAPSPMYEAMAIQASSVNLAASSSTLAVPAERSRLDIRI